MIIYLGVPLLTPSCDLPGCVTKRAASLQMGKPHLHVTLLGLAPGGVCLANDIAALAGSLLHYRFTLAGRSSQPAASA